MRETPERQSAARMGRNLEAEMFVIASRKTRIEPTLPKFHDHLRQKKAEVLAQPVKIIDDDDGDDEEETKPVIKQTRKKLR